jgi:hypothetical protein
LSVGFADYKPISLFEKKDKLINTKAKSGGEKTTSTSRYQGGLSKKRSAEGLVKPI